MVSDSVAEPASIDLDRETLQPESALDGLRILLVDDDADTRDAITAVLAECGAKVVAVGCGADALKALKNEAPNVLVSDIAMPGMDGQSLMRRIRELRARRGSIPAIALTGYASPADRTQALLAGYQVFLPKPFDPTELITLVAKLAGPTPSSREDRRTVAAAPRRSAAARRPALPDAVLEERAQLPAEQQEAGALPDPRYVTYS